MKNFKRRALVYALSIKRDQIGKRHAVIFVVESKDLLVARVIDLARIV